MKTLLMLIAATSLTGVAYADGGPKLPQLPGLPGLYAPGGPKLPQLPGLPLVRELNA